MTRSSSESAAHCSITSAFSALTPWATETFHFSQRPGSHQPGKGMGQNDAG